MTNALRSLEQQINNVLVNREEVAHTAVLALLSKQHHLQIGEPGTGKSLLANTLCASIGGVEVFNTLLSRTTEPDELFGNISFKGMEDDDYRRVTNGFAPEADIWFLDEFFKAGDALLNNFLTAMNERTFRNGKTTSNLPLISVFAGSNELYDTEALNALYSRFTFRHWVEYVGDFECFEIMVKRTLDPLPIEPVIEKEELEELQKKVEEVNVTGETLEALWEVKSTLEQGGFKVDDRKMVWLATKVARAEAVYNGHDETSVEHLFPIQHCLWDQPEDRNKVRQIVLSIVNPVAEECATYIDSAKQIWTAMQDAIAEANGDQRSITSQAIDASTELAEILTSIQKRIKESSNGSRDQLEKAQDEVEKTQKKVLANMGLGLGIKLDTE